MPVRALVEKWLRDTKDKEPDSDTRGKDHGKVSAGVKLWLFILSSKLDIIVPNGNVNQKEEEYGLGPNEEPSKVECHLAAPSRESAV